MANNSSDLEIITLDEEIKNPLVELYARVFAGPPWYEQFRCKNCGEEYGGENETRDSLIEKYGGCTNEKCPEYNNSLDLVSFYKGEYYDMEEGKKVSNLGEEIFLDALSKKGFIGIAGKKNNNLIGFSWGYKIPKERSPSVWFDEVQKKLKEKNINTENLFYSAETGVDPKYQKKGIGTRLMGERLDKAKENGFDMVAFRTVNPKLVEVYENLYGKDNGEKLFRDPNPSKSDDDYWYAFKI